MMKPGADPVKQFGMIPNLQKDRKGTNMKKELEVDTVTLFTDDGEVECGIVTILQMNEKEYIALSPLDEDGEVTEEIWLYQFIRDPSGKDDHDIIFIEDEEEYDQVIDQFDEWLDTLEFEEE